MHFYMHLRVTRHEKLRLGRDCLYACLDLRNFVSGVSEGALKTTLSLSRSVWVHKSVQLRNLRAWKIFRQSVTVCWCSMEPEFYHYVSMVIALVNGN